MKLVHNVKVKFPLGLHSRPAALIVRLLQTRSSSVMFTSKKGVTINAKSIMSILMLAARRGDPITITVEGSDAKETMFLLVNAFEEGVE